MGKKRRLMSAKAKFAAKHSTHPRMVLLNNQTETPTLAAEIGVKAERVPEVVIAPPSPPVEEATMKTEPVKPKVKAATSTAKKRAPSTKKRSTTTRTARKSRAKKKISTEASA